MRRTFNQLVLAALPAYTRRELPGWGKLLEVFASPGGEERWRDAGTREIDGTRHGYRMALDISHWSDRFTYFVGRWYDLATQLLVREAVSQGDVVIDVGANIGMFALAARSAVGETGIIHCFEPNPLPRATLTRHVEINALSNVVVHPFALSDVNGSAMMHVPISSSGEGSLAKPGYADDAMTEVAVDLKIGDEVLAGLSPRLIKIDVEGAEISVLTGLDKLVASARPIILCEANETHLARFGCGFDDLASFAERHAYEVYYIGTTRNRHAPLLTLSRVNRAAPRATSDVVFVPPRDKLLECAVIL